MTTFVCVVSTFSKPLHEIGTQKIFTLTIKSCRHRKLQGVESEKNTVSKVYLIRISASSLKWDWCNSWGTKQKWNRTKIRRWHKDAQNSWKLFQSTSCFKSMVKSDFRFSCWIRWASLQQIEGKMLKLRKEAEQNYIWQYMRMNNSKILIWKVQVWFTGLLLLFVPNMSKLVFSVH